MYHQNLALLVDQWKSRERSLTQMIEHLKEQENYKQLDQFHRVQGKYEMTKSMLIELERALLNDFIDYD